MVKGRQNPFLPYHSSVRGEGPHILQSPNNLRSAIGILQNLPSTPKLSSVISKMPRRCIKCHLYISSAPSLDLCHTGSDSGLSCSLQHHPNPCDWIDQNNLPCLFYPTGQASPDNHAENQHIRESGTVGTSWR